MTFYVALLLIAAMLSTIIKPSHSEKARLTYVAIVFTMLIAVAAFRSYTVGVDTGQFVRAYTRIGIEGVSAFQTMRYEPGFTALCLLLNQVSSNYQLLLIITAIGIYAPIGYAVYRLSENVTLSCYLFITMTIYTSYMNVMRQALSVALVVVAFLFLVKRKNAWFVVCVLASSLLHSYSWVALVLLPLSKLGFKKKHLLVYAIVAIFIIFRFEWVLSATQLILGREEVYRSAYMSSNYFGAVIQLLFTATIALLVVNYIEVGKASLEDMTLANLYQHAVMLWLVSQLLGVQAEIFGRLGYNFEIFSILSIPYAMKIAVPKERRLLLVLVCSMTFAYFLVVGIMRPEWQGVIPYVVDLSNIKALIGL